MVSEGTLPFFKKYTKYVKVLNNIHRFSTLFFTLFFRLYLFTFRQPKFFRFISFVLGKIFTCLGVLDTKIEFFGLDNESVSAMFLARYIARKIEMRFKVKELFTPIGKELRLLVKNTANLLGYKLQFVGRLTRRGRVRTT